MFHSIHEECGVFGICEPCAAPVAQSVYFGLYALQHRGQESCGIAVNDDGVFQHYRDMGLVYEVFSPERLQQLGTGSMAIGHVRYSTTGNVNRVNAQPLVIRHVKGNMALAHNGNITNSVNLPEVVLPRATESRICVIHRNIPHMLTQISSTVSSENLNIENMINKSKKDYAYTVLDIVGKVSEKAVEEIKSIDGVIRVTVID